MVCDPDDADEPTGDQGAKQWMTASRRRVLRGTLAAAGVAGLGVTGLAGTGSASGHTDESREFRVRVENVSEQGTFSTSEGDTATPLSPGVYAVHTEGEPLFSGLAPASEGLERLAEDGVPGPLANEVQGETGVVESGVFAGEATIADENDPAGSVPGRPPIFPGGAFEFTVTGGPDEYLSLATMVVQTNDIFVAPDVTGIPLYEDGDPISGDVTDQLYLWDAGTEVDQEPGVGPDQAPRQAGSDTGPTEDNSVAPVSLTDVGGFDLPAVSDIVRVTVTPVPTISIGSQTALVDLRDGDDFPVPDDFVVELSEVTFAGETGTIALPVENSDGQQGVSGDDTFWYEATNDAPAFVVGLHSRSVGNGQPDSLSSLIGVRPLRPGTYKNVKVPVWAVPPRWQRSLGATPDQFPSGGDTVDVSATIWYGPDVFPPTASRGGNNAIAQTPNDEQNGPVMDENGDLVSSTASVTFPQ